eukprot:4789437-Amphidinium_carterae.1
MHVVRRAVCRDQTTIKPNKITDTCDNHAGVRKFFLASMDTLWANPSFDIRVVWRRQALVCRPFFKLAIVHSWNK